MNKLSLLLAPFLVTLIGCTTQLRPNQNIDNYYVTVGAQQYPALLCATTPKGESCLNMLDGPKVKIAINGYLAQWLPSLKLKEMTTNTLGRSVYQLPKAQGAKVLQALVDDLRHREFERWAERYNDDDRFFDW